MFDFEAAERRADGDREGAARVWTVGALTRRIGELVGGLGAVAVQGEVSRCTRAASGHVYFDLVDQGAKLACAVWRSQVPRALRFELREGQQVVVHGELGVYAPRGTYSLSVARVEQAGLGELLARLEELKRALKERGWFDRKRPLPPLPRLVGVVTSRDGAAFQDFLRTRSLRWPLYPVRLAHTPVQGPGAAESIAAAIRRLDASGVDVVVVCRGGGSLEDLWCFNEACVAEAIWASRAPVVSGVGHQTDTTLADLVADRRAHTPTDAAQTVIPDRAALLAELARAAGHLDQALEALLGEREERLERLARARVMCEAGWILADRQRTLERLHGQLLVHGPRAGERAHARLLDLHKRVQLASPRSRFEAMSARLVDAGWRLRPLGERELRRKAERVGVAAGKLDALSPLRILERGYSITTRRGAKAPLSDAGALAPGDELQTRLHRGEVVSRVVSVEPPDAAGRP